MKYTSLDLNEISRLEVHIIPERILFLPFSFTSVRDSSRGILHYRPDDQRIVVRFPTEQGDLSSPKPETGTGRLHVYYWALGALSATVQQPGYEDHHSTPVGPEPKNAWSYSSTLPHVLIRAKGQLYFLRYFTARQRKLSWTDCWLSFMCLNTMGTPIRVRDIVTELIINNALIMHCYVYAKRVKLVQTVI